MLNIEKIETKSVKIALVVIISLLIGNLFKLYSPYLIAINAVVAVQSTIYDSVSFGKDRVLGTVIGAVVGIVIVTYLLHNIIITAIGIFLIIYACNLLNLKGSVAIAATVCLSIIIFPSPNYNAINVTISTAMGVFIAIIVNMLVSPFELTKNLNKSYYELKENMFFLYLKVFTDIENIELEDFNSQVITFKALVESYNKEYFKIQDKKLKYEQVETLYKNIHGISFFLAAIIELGGNNLNDANVSRVNNLLQLDLIALDYEECQNNNLFNFHIDKLLDYLEKPLEPLEPLGTVPNGLSNEKPLGTVPNGFRAPGMRTIKTSIAVAICLVISKSLDLYYPYYAAIAAILCIRSTVSDSINAAKSRAFGTIIGSLLGIFCVFIFPYNPWLSGIGVLLLIYFLKTINFEDAFIVACIVFLAIFIPNHGSSISYGLHRTIDTLIGILIALILNLLLSPPEYAEDIHNLSNKLIDDLFICSGNFLIHNKDMELSTIGIEILEIEKLIKNYKQDVKKSKIKIINSDKFNLLIHDSKELYNHLGIIKELNKLGYNCILNEENGDYIRDLYNHKLTFCKYENTPCNEAFNYHVKELLKYLDNFRNLNLK